VSDELAALVAAEPDPAHGCPMLPGVDLVVQSARLDPAAVWQDLSARVAGVDVTLGAAAAYGRRAVATADLTLDNADGQLDPWRPPPAVFVGAWWLVRVGVRFGGRWSPIMTGLVDTIRHRHGVDQAPTVDVAVADTGTWLAQDRNPFVDDQWAGDTAPTRLLRILERAQWPFGSTLTGPAGYPLIGTRMAGGPLAEAWLTADSAGGVFDVAPDGRARYRDVDPPSSAVAVMTDECPTADPPFDPGRRFGDLTFGQQVYGALTGDVPVVEYVRVDLVTGVDRMVNRAVAGNTAGDLVVVDRRSSIDRYGVHAAANGWPRTNLLTRDVADLAALADQALTRFAVPVRRVDLVELVADPSRPDLWQLAARLIPGARVNVRRTRDGDPWEVEARVHGARHRIVPNPGAGTWSVALVTAPS
jgi:hypothetical protein